MPAPGGPPGAAISLKFRSSRSGFRPRYGARELTSKPSILQRSNASENDSSKSPSGARKLRLERNLVVHFVAFKAGWRLARTARSRRRAAVATAVEKHHLTPEALQHNFGRIAFRSVLVGPFAGLQLAFQKH